MTSDWKNISDRIRHQAYAAEEEQTRLRNRALEEAACIADDCEVGPEHVNAAIKIAEAIRARKENP